MKDRGVDDREEVQILFANLGEALSELEELLEKCTSHWGYEDPIYRFYHHSFKVYRLQDMTSNIIEALRALMPDVELNAKVLKIVGEGTGISFSLEHNARWEEVTRPILEAFFHARHFLEMAVKYGHELDEPPLMLPSGWATFLYLYGLR